MWRSADALWGFVAPNDWWSVSTSDVAGWTSGHRKTRRALRPARRTMTTAWPQNGCWEHRTKSAANSKAVRQTAARQWPVEPPPVEHERLAVPGRAGDGVRDWPASHMLRERAGIQQARRQCQHQDGTAAPTLERRFGSSPRQHLRRYQAQRSNSSCVSTTTVPVLHQHLALRRGNSQIGAEWAIALQAFGRPRRGRWAATWAWMTNQLGQVQATGSRARWPERRRTRALNSYTFWRKTPLARAPSGSGSGDLRQF